MYLGMSDLESHVYRGQKYWAVASVVYSYSVTRWIFALLCQIAWERRSTNRGELRETPERLYQPSWWTRSRGSLCYVDSSTIQKQRYTFAVSYYSTRSHLAKGLISPL